MFILTDKSPVIDSAKTVFDSIVRKICRKDDVHTGVWCYDVYGVCGALFLYNRIYGTPETPYIGLEGIAWLKLHIVFSVFKRRGSDRVVDFV